MHPRVKVRIASIVLFVFVLTSGFICSPSQIHKATVAEHDFKVAVQGFQSAEIAEFNAGNITPATNAQINLYLEKIAQGGAALTTLLQNSDSAGALQEIGIIDSTIQGLLANGVLQIKNPTTMSALQTALLAIQAIVTNVQTALS